MFNIKQNQQGVSLYLTIVVLSVLTAALLALVGISVSQIKVIHTLGHSVTAFYAADTGIEHCLYNLQKEGGTGEVSGNLDGINYSVSLGGSDIYTSIGSYNETKRAIELTL